MRITYYEEEGLIYWTMGNPVDETTIINRTAKENSYEERLMNGTLPPEKQYISALFAEQAISYYTTK